MQAEIISNGDEITCGKILDSNSQWLSLELADLGVSTLYHTTVGDDLDAMVDVLRIAMNRVDLIIWTGGLGPTADDLTRQAVADAAGVPLEKDEKSLRLIQEMFQRRNREMPKSNEIQAFQPRGALPINNPHGTAPGIDFTTKRKTPVPGRLEFYRVLAYPGVPAEMKEMWNETGRKSIREMLDKLNGQKRVIRFRSIHSFGLGESQVEAMLPDIVNRKHFPKVGITATRATITLRIVAEGETEAECSKIMEPTAKLIYEALGDRIYGEGNDQLQDVVCRKLKAKNKTIAVVEAGTSGLLAKTINQSKEAAGCFLGGIVLPPKTPIAPEAMIQIGKRISDADYFLLIGAYPVGEPDRARSDETFVAVIDPRQTNLQSAVISIQNYPYVGHPDIIDDLYIKRVLDLLRHQFDTTIDN
jgi:nicotinamide-nucleotide amidase